LQYFVVQKAMIIFNGYLKREPQRLVIPQTMLREVLQPQDAAPAPAKVQAAPIVAPAEEIVEPKPADVVAEVADAPGRGR
jgi:hypothetical protein